MVTSPIPYLFVIISVISVNFIRRIIEKYGKYVEWKKQLTEDPHATCLPPVHAHTSQCEALRKAEAAVAGCLPSEHFACCGWLHATRLWSTFGQSRLAECLVYVKLSHNTGDASLSLQGC